MEQTLSAIAKCCVWIAAIRRKWTCSPRVLLKPDPGCDIRLEPRGSGTTSSFDTLVDRDKHSLRPTPMAGGSS